MIRIELTYPELFWILVGFLALLFICAWGSYEYAVFKLYPRVRALEEEQRKLIERVEGLRS